MVTIGCILIVNFIIALRGISQPDSNKKEKEPGQQGEVVKTKRGRLDINFKNADIEDVLRLISEKSKVNIIVGKKVKGEVTVSLENVEWKNALESILGAYDYGYEREGNIITVTTFKKLKERNKTESKLAEVQPVESAVFKLEYLDASDVAEAVKGLLSKRGTVTVVKKTGQTGWEFGGGESGLGKRKKVKKRTTSRSKVLLVNDIPSDIDRIREVIKKIDRKPKQILIEARIMEVNHDKLKDIGIDWGTGSTGAESDTLEYIDLNEGNDKKIGGQILGDQVTPSNFTPETSGITSSNTGLKVSFKKLTGAEFEAILHALKEDVEANTLSAPKILTLDNQEASILVGQKYPIVKSETSTETSQITGGSLEYYQDIGIQLNVIPQICGKKENFINMVIHPAVTSRLQDVTISTEGGKTLVSYPWLTSREAETSVLVEDGQTVVIGGLLKNVKSKGVTKVPLLGDIPLLGLLFQRTTTDKEKIDLLIFITANIVEEPDLKKAERKKFENIKEGK